MKELTCIICPKGCSLSVAEVEGEIRVSGAQCPRGDKYAAQELTNPRRSLQTTVKTTLPGVRRAAVKISREVPLKEIFLYMEAINKIVLREKLKCGDIIEKGLRGTDVDLILTERLY